MEFEEIDLFWVAGYFTQISYSINPRLKIDPFCLPLSTKGLSDVTFTFGWLVQVWFIVRCSHTDTLSCLTVSRIITLFCLTRAGLAFICSPISLCAGALRLSGLERGSPPHVASLSEPRAAREIPGARLPFLLLLASHWRFCAALPPAVRRGGGELGQWVSDPMV